MSKELERKIEELEKSFGTEIIDQSWYYCFLKERCNQLINQDKISKTISVIKLEEKTEKELEEIKYKILRDSLTIIKPNMAMEWLSLINKNINNTYYVNIINAAICLINEINNGKSIEEVEKKVLKDDFDLSAFQLKTLQNIISKYFDDNIYIFGTTNKSPLNSLNGFSK